jgi:hypothetical protein
MRLVLIFDFSASRYVIHKKIIVGMKPVKQQRTRANRTVQISVIKVKSNGSDLKAAYINVTMME